MTGFRQILVFSALFALTTVAAIAEGPSIRTVEVGFGGHVKHGKWCELRASIHPGEAAFWGRLKVDSRDGDAVPVTYCGALVDIKPGEEIELRTLVKVGPPESQLQVRLCDERGQTVATSSLSAAAVQPHASTAFLYASLGAELELGSASEPLRRSGAEELSGVVLSDWTQLPTTPLAYGSLDTLIIVAGDENPLASAGDKYRNALLEWVQLGGHVVVICGATSPELLDLSGPWGRLSPGAFLGSSPLTTDAGLRALGGESLSLDSPSIVVQFDIQKADVALGEAGANSERALIIEQPAGMGWLTFFTIDLSKSPLKNWPSRGKLLARLLSGEAINSERTESVRMAGGRMTHLGYRDLSGQLRSALEQYEGVSTVHFYSIAGLLVVYLLVLGPGEYFFLRRATPTAMHVTWLVFPLLVAGFAIGAYALGRSSRGGQLRFNQLELVDIDAVDGRQRGTTWLGMFSPQAATFSIALEPRVSLPEARVQGSQLSWQALPGKSLAGVDGRPLTSPFQSPYDVEFGSGEEPARLQGLPLAMGSSKLLSGSWWGTVAPNPQASQLKKGRLVDLEGSFTNIVPVTLSNAYLAHGEWLYRARDEVEPGTSLSVDQMDRRYLETLPQRRVTSSDLAAPWNQEEMEVPRILEVMMFHDAVRGRSYTVLTHRYQPELDLSRLLKRGHAVLVGRSQSPVTQTRIDDRTLEPNQVQRWTIYRIIYPVAEYEGDAPAQP